MILSRKAFISLFVALVGCSDGGSGGSKVDGVDFSGNWKFLGVECYDSNFSAVTAAAIPDPASGTDTTVIAGNTLTSTLTDAGGSCSVEVKQSFRAVLEEGDLDRGYGTGTFGHANAVVSNGSTCTTNMTLSMVRGTITPSRTDTTYVHNEAIGGKNFDFLSNAPMIAFGSTYKVSGSPSDVCLLIYKKQ